MSEKLGPVNKPAEEVGVPLKMLQLCEGHIVKVYTTFKEVYEGKLDRAEDNMNCTLSSVTVTRNSTGTSGEMDNVYIAGCKVKMVVLPDAFKHCPLLRMQELETRRGGTGRARGRGRRGGSSYGGYSSRGGSSSRQDCDRHQEYSSRDGSSSRQDCDRQRYSSRDGSSSRQDCDRQRYSSRDGSSSRQDCDRHGYSSRDGSSSRHDYDRHHRPSSSSSCDRHRSSSSRHGHCSSSHH